ncbi:MAG TPA: TraY domain-containing protein [Tepidisphaeraceae bacterium]|nr:TraY domain-containing protein [Tepidisphaeraceae bacterium]
MPNDPTTLTLHLDDQTSRRLAELARRSGKSAQDVALDALREHLRHADPSLGTDKPVPPPKGG